MKLLTLLCLVLTLLCSCQKGSDRSGSEAPGPVAGTASDTQTGQDAAGGGSTSANPCAGLASARGMRMRGLVLESGDGLIFTPCDSELSFPVSDAAAGLLGGLLTELGQDTGSVYVQMEASSDGDTVVLEQLWRAAPVHESFGCREDLSGLLYLARGNEPFWGIEVRDTSEIALLRPGSETAGVEELLFDVSDSRVDGSSAWFLGSSREDGPGIEIRLETGACRDSMSGDWFGMQAEIQYGDTVYHGCAWPGEAAGFEDQP